MRIHLGHHFYGAGNLGDDFMLAGFLSAMSTLAPEATFTCCIPFPLDPLRRRFPSIAWLPCDERSRAACIEQCDVWLGLGGSPFQHSLSRWFVDHLLSETSLCQRHDKPMFFLGVGVQTATELIDPAIRQICSRATAIWTRDPASAARLATLPQAPLIASAADLAHVFFRENPPPPCRHGRLTLVANFDYGAWPGQDALLNATKVRTASFAPSEFVWLAQESRELPGAERALHSALPDSERARWQLIVPDEPSPDDTSGPEFEATDTLPRAPSRSLSSVWSRWPTGEWLITARFHAALAGAWAGSKIVVITTNEKLRAASRELGCVVLAPDADEATATAALHTAAAPSPPRAFPQAILSTSQPPRAPSMARPAVAPSLIVAADQAYAACTAFVRAARGGPLSGSAVTSAVAPARPTP